MYQYVQIGNSRTDLYRLVLVRTGTYQYVPFCPILSRGTGFQMRDRDCRRGHGPPSDGPGRRPGSRSLPVSLRHRPGCQWSVPDSESPAVAARPGARRAAAGPSLARRRCHPMIHWPGPPAGRRSRSLAPVANSCPLGDALALGLSRSEIFITMTCTGL